MIWYISCNRDDAKGTQSKKRRSACSLGAFSVDDMVADIGVFVIGGKRSGARTGNSGRQDISRCDIVPIRRKNDWKMSTREKVCRR